MGPTWQDARRTFLAEERAHDKVRPIARRHTLELLEALEAAGCDLGAISSFHSSIMGTSISFVMLDHKWPAEELNPRLEAQRKIVLTITRHLGIDGRKEKQDAYYNPGALAVTWTKEEPVPKDENGISLFSDPEYIKRRALAWAASVRVCEYMPPTCRFVSVVKHVPACAAHDVTVTEVVCGPEVGEVAESIPF